MSVLAWLEQHPTRYSTDDCFFYTRCMSLFDKRRDRARALECFAAMRKRGVRPDLVAYNTAVSVCGRTGDLQGALALLVTGSLSTLFAEVAHGTPVIVLQNLGLSIAPRWHYAVVVGFDLRRREVVLRSGLNRREVMAMSTFEHTWARSNYWGMLIPRSGQFPRSADRTEVEKTLVQLEKYADPTAMLSWYQQAAERWPESLVFLIGLGQLAYHQGQLQDAERAFRQATDRHPQSAAAVNNLAIVLQRLGRLDEALAYADKAVALGGPWQAAAQATRDDIRRNRRTGASQ